MVAAFDPDDLLQPVLEPEDDAVALGRPWRPWSLVILGVFAGSLAAGPLSAWNFRWLGQRSATLPALLLVLVWWVGGLWAGFELYGRDQLEARVAERSARPVAAEDGQRELADWEQRRARWRPILRIVDLAPLLAFAALQRRRFRVFEGAGGEPRSLWIAGLCAMLVALGLTLVALPLLTAATLGG